uniref:B9 domain-containing protein 2 n=1 Tax=Ditylenchus dipsaci TaxID=166011 RepID=A0A915ERN0_9BILA
MAERSAATQIALVAPTESTQQVNNHSPASELLVVASPAAAQPTPIAVGSKEPRAISQDNLSESSFVVIAEASWQLESSAVDEDSPSGSVSPSLSSQTGALEQEQERHYLKNLLKRRVRCSTADGGSQKTNKEEDKIQKVVGRTEMDGGKMPRRLKNFQMAEVHIFGQIESAESFPDNRLSCRWTLRLAGGWRLIEGDQEGQTQTDLSELDKAYFAHPIDIHLATRTIQGWPKILIEVWHYDQYARQEVYGYGTVFMPTSPGEHEIQCHCWRPKGGLKDELMQKFIGGGLQLRSLSVLDDPLQRMKLQTVAMGVVNLRLAVITRHFDRFGIMC